MTVQKQSATKKDWALFVAVMVIFIVGMIALMIAKITNIWIWVVYIWIWSYAEMKIAKNIRLKWWIWGVIIAILCVLDLVLIFIFH